MGQALAIARSTPGNRSRPAREAPHESGLLRTLTERVLLRFLGTLHRVVYRASRGRLGGTIQGRAVLLLTTVGRRSGQARTWPLCYVQEGDALILVASAGGSARHAGWYLNLLARRRVMVQQGGRIGEMLARTTEGSERARLWERVVRQYPICADYQRRTDRLVPVVVLEPIAGSSAGWPRWSTSASSTTGTSTRSRRSPRA